MKKRCKILALASVMVMSLSAGIACSKTYDDTSPSSSSSAPLTAKVTLFTDDTNVALAGTKQMRVLVENGNETDVTYEIVSGPATVSANGVVTVAQTAQVGDKIKVVAKLGSVSSNAVELTVVEAVATAITLTPSSTTIAKGQVITFSATYTPSYATTTEYTLSIEGNCDFAEITQQNTLKIKDTAQPQDIDGREIRVKATLTANSAVFNYAFITVSEEPTVTYLACETVNFVAGKDSSKSIITEAYNWDGTEMTIDANDLTYAVADENVLTVDATGLITAKGHGSTVVTVTYGTVTTECEVNIMVAPERVKFDNLNTYTNSVGSLYFGIGDNNYLDLGVVTEKKTGYLSSTTQVSYKFKNLDNDDTQDVATFTQGKGINFEQTGRIEVTVISNSSLDGYEVNEANETKKTIIVNVNEGINVYTLTDLRTAAGIANKGKTINVLADLYLTDTDNYGNADNRYIGLTFEGSKTIQGNGYKVSAERLSVGSELVKGKYSLFHFNHGYQNEALSVAIYDWTILGNINVEGKHNGTTDITDGTDVKNNFYRAIEISGAELAQYDCKPGQSALPNAILESAIVKNVTIKGFYTALRYEHAISALAEKVVIGDCYANGIEAIQSHLVIKDVEIGQVGAFAIEVSSDDMRGHKDPTTAVAGTAGRQYNETATIRYEGYFKCNNLNNGAATPYMRALASDLGASITQLLQAATLGLVQELANGDTTVANGLTTILGQTIMNSNMEVNFSTLVFVNPSEFTQHLTEGNTTNKFCEFSTTEKINMKTLLQNCIANSNYNFKEKKFIILDLANLDIGVGIPVNLGQVILMNQAYQG